MTRDFQVLKRALSNDTEKIDDIAAMVILKSWIENNEHS